MTLSPTVRRRCVFFFGGYEHVPVERQYRRFTRELERFKATWNVTAAASVPSRTARDPVIGWDVETAGPNWSVATEYRYCAWDDLIDEDFQRPDWIALPQGVLALLDFLTFAFVPYLRTNWRYALFFLYPLLLLTLFEIAGIAVAWWAIERGLPAPWLLGPVLALGAIWALVRWPGDWLNLRYMLNDWSFARSLVREPRAAYRDRIEAFAAQLVARVRAGKADEIVLVGHSLGSVLLIETLAAALEREPDLARHGLKIRVMTAGSSLLKIGLHPAGGRLRAAVLRVVEDDDLFWVDYQALLDVISFYKCNPAEEMRLPTQRRPLIRTTRLRNMLSEASYRRFRTNYLRLHRQFVMGNERRYHYDYFMICCGPMPLPLRALRPDVAVKAFAPDGSYAPPAEAARETREPAEGGGATA